MKFDKMKFIHNSNAIEGIDTSMEEIKEATRLKKSGNPHIWNHLKAFEYVESMRYPLTPLKILEVHKKLSFGIMDKKDCGKFREGDVHIAKGGTVVFAPPNWKKLPSLIKDLIFAINSKKDPWLCHMEFEYIHPFVDFNGRTGRLLLYWQEKAQGTKPRIILNEGKGTGYYDKLSEYEKRDRPNLWRINIWKKVLTNNQTYVCMECGTHHMTVVEKCPTCGNINESKFEIYAEAPPFVGPIV